MIKKHKLIFLTGVLLLLLVLSRPISTAVKTCLLISEFGQVILKHSFPRPLLAITQPPVVREINIPAQNGPLPADLYLPAGKSGRLPAALFMYGLTDGFHGPDLVRLSAAFARLGVVVLVPHFSIFNDNRLVDKRVKQDVLDSFSYLYNQNYVDKKKVGFMTFCIGGSHALIAASNPKISGKVAYVQTIAPFFDLTSFAKASFSKEYGLDGKKVAWMPNSKTSYVFRKEFLSLLSTTEQKILYKAIWEGELNNKNLNSLSKQGKIIWTLFNTKDPDLINTLVDEIDSGHKDRHDEFSPSTYLKNIKAPVFIATGIADTYIPVSESVDLVNKLKTYRKNVYFARLDLLTHGVPENQFPTVKFSLELSKLWFYIYNVLLTAS